MVTAVTQDGGCTCPGDVAKAFGEYTIMSCDYDVTMMSSGAGADFVMMGGMLAGHDQSGEQYAALCTPYSVAG